MNEIEIPTPRTDAEQRIWLRLKTNGETYIDEETIVASDFARQLERENAAMREVIKEALESLDCLSLVVGLTPILGNKEAIQEANDQARAILNKFKAHYLP